jgi:hypothetical protein
MHINIQYILNENSKLGVLHRKHSLNIIYEYVNEPDLKTLELIHTVGLVCI